MSDHEIKSIESKYINLANEKGAFIVDIITKRVKVDELNNYLIRARSLDTSIEIDWMEFESKDPAFDFADYLVNYLKK